MACAGKSAGFIYAAIAPEVDSLAVSSTELHASSVLCNLVMSIALSLFADLKVKNVWAI